MKNRHPLPENPLHSNALYFLFASIAFSGFPHFWNLPLWVTGLFLCSIGSKSLLIKKQKFFKSRLIPILLAVPAVIAIYFQFNTLLGLDASISLLLVMLGLKVLELKEYRDAMLVVFLGFFIVITVFLFRQSLVILPYLIVSGFMLTLCLHMLNDFTGKQTIRHQLRINIAMLISCAPLVILLFVFFPRLDSPLWKLPGSGQSKTGMSDSMSPGQFSKLAQSFEPAFRVSFSGPMPSQDKLYWRGPVLSDFDGRRWTRANDNKHTEPPDIDFIGDDFQYTMTLEPHHSNWVFALNAPVYYPKDTQLNKDMELVSSDSINKAVSLSLTSSLDYKLNNNRNSQQIQSALSLPPNSSKRTIKLARSMYEKAGRNDTRFIQQVMSFYNQEKFYYTLEPEPMSSDYIDSFMFDTRQGFCEHYSSSFVVMMRAVGIPARIVTGYQGGDWNESGQYLLVRQSDAHAWTEVWQEGSGWNRFDPTAMVAPARVNSGLFEALGDTSFLPVSMRFSLLKKLGMQWDGLNYQWTKWVVSYNNQLRSELLQKLKLSTGNWGRMIIGLLLFIAALILFWITTYNLYLWWRTPRDKELSLYLRFTKEIKRITGLTRGKSETELAFASRVVATSPELTDSVGNITRLFNELRYSESKPTSTAADEQSDQYSQLHKLIRQFGKNNR